MADVMILWYRSTSLIGWIVAHATASRFTHVAIAATEQTPAGPVPVLWEALGSGIRKRVGVDASERMSAAVAERTLVMGDEDARQVRAFLDRNVADHYSILGAIAAGIGNLTGWRVKIMLDHTYICSGFVACALARAGIEFDHDPETMTPGDLAQALRAEWRIAA